MGADIKQLRTRIKSVDSTLHLTKAMGLVASSKIRRARSGMLRGREYADAVGKTVSQLVSCPECAKSPYMAKRQTKRIKLIVIAGDRGLAGGYNANVFRLLRDYPEADILPIGKRACDRFGGELHYAETFGYSDAKALASLLCREFAEEAYDQLGIIYTKYLSMMSQEAQLQWLLPLSRQEGISEHSVIFEPDEITVLNTVIPEYVAGNLLALVRESFASEVAARSFAMDSAGKNAQQMIDDLNLAYNRARQGSITQEITEIVAGSGT
ncbi:MAG: ATP synthase F1 subunit gamma [Clostridia bacterium]|nr:ATP synthase F1 subunit gamma [Clostridia bacterium]